MKRLKIGLFVDSFFPMIDGVVMVVDNYAKRLSKVADVIVFAPRYVGKPYDDSVFPYKVVRCMSLKVPFIDYDLPAPKMDNKFVKNLKKYNLDIVHIHSPFMIGKMGVNYAKKNRIPCIATMHSQFYKDFLRAVKSPKIAKRLTKNVIKVFNQCTECWAVNSEVARIFYEEYGYKTMPVVMNNATEMEPLEDTKKAVKLVDKRYGLKNEKVLIFVGRINALKNIFFIVDALKIVKEKEPKLKFKMLFVGSGQDEEDLRKQIDKYDMNSEIIMCGRVTDRELLASLYVRSDLFLFPSLYDASSIVQIEAASQKTPVMFLEGAATAATVTNNVNGFIVENDVNAYADRIIELFKDEKFLKQIGENAFNDLYRSWDYAVSEVYEKYLEKIAIK